MMKLHFKTIMFGKRINTIGDMQQFLLGFCRNFVLGRCPIGKVRISPLTLSTNADRSTDTKKIHFLEEEKIIFFC